MAKKTFPLEDLSVRNLPGEKWVDIKGYRGYYQVSSHGRVRSAERIIKKISHWNDKQVKYHKAMMIKRQKINVKRNDYAGTPLYECQVSLWLDNQEERPMVSRLVYEHFVAPLDREKDGLLVTHIDGDGRNNHYKNLIAVSWGEIRRIAHATGRQRSGFATMSQAKLRKIHKILSEKGKTPVQQISASGKVLKNYASIQEAADDVGCDRNYMTHVLKGRKTHVRGKFFRYKE